LDLLNQTSPVTTVNIANGTYEEVKFKLNKSLESSSDLFNKTVEIRGTINGTPFVYWHNFESEFEIDYEDTAQNLVVSNEQMRKLFNDQSVQVIDARTVNEFKGNDIRAIRGGHIPGAISIPYEQNWKDPAAGLKLAKKEVKTNAGMSLKTKDELNALYAKLDPNKETVVYCQSGVRAAETATVLQNLGYKNVKIYDSSWLGWASHLASPVADETYLNVGMLNARIAAMQNKINELETALKGNKN
jgi:thiosulfate/3-mercaptopyruvate sulfurtransferase